MCCGGVEVILILAFSSNYPILNPARSLHFYCLKGTKYANEMPEMVFFKKTCTCYTDKFCEVNETKGAVVVVQLVERTLPTPEVRV